MGGKEGSIVELEDAAVERVLRWAMIETGELAQLLATSNESAGR